MALEPFVQAALMTTPACQQAGAKSVLYHPLRVAWSCYMQITAETRDRTGDLQIFSLTLSQLSYRGMFATALTNIAQERAARALTSIAQERACVCARARAPAPCLSDSTGMSKRALTGD